MNLKSPSRRLVLSSGAAGALAINSGLASQDVKFPIPSAPKKSPKAEGERIRVGLIGCGGMGSGHLGSMMGQREANKEAFDVVAVCDVNQIRLDQAQKTATERQEGVTVVAYEDHRDLLAQKDIDCVLIASPEHWHATMAVDAIAAGKDVYCEKPMTLSIEEALWMRDTMDANPHMRLQVGTQYMMYEKYQVARKWVSEGRIGQPTLSQTSYCRNSKNGEWLYGIDPKVKPGETLNWERWCGPNGLAEFDTEVYHRWRRYRHWSTGIIGDLLVHMMTPLMYSLDRGWPVRVSASGGHYSDKAMENHDQVMLTVEFEKEHTMIVAGSTCNEQGLEVLIRGHEANLYLGSNDCELRPERIFADDVDPERHECARISPQEALRLNWLKCVRTREENISQVELAAQVMIVVDLATRSMWTGSAWGFDPATGKAKAL